MTSRLTTLLLLYIYILSGWISHNKYCC